MGVRASARLVSFIFIRPGHSVLVVAVFPLARVSTTAPTIGRRRVSLLPESAGRWLAIHIGRTCWAGAVRVSWKARPLCPVRPVTDGRPMSQSLRVCSGTLRGGCRSVAQRGSCLPVHACPGAVPSLHAAGHENYCGMRVVDLPPPAAVLSPTRSRRWSPPARESVVGHVPSRENSSEGFAWISGSIQWRLS